MPLAVCATPIGNLDDITFRVLDGAPRRRRRAGGGHTAHARLARPARDRRDALSYHEHNEAARVAELMPRLEAGERIALVTDAGMPLVSDPGARLVRAALDAHVPVTVLPGRVRGRDGTRRERPRRRAVRVRRLSAAQGGRARGSVARDCAWGCAWSRSSRRTGSRPPSARWLRSIPHARSPSAAS